MDLRLLLLLFALLPACGKAPPLPPPTHPVVLIGVDGLEWSVMRPLLESGRLPNLARLAERGVAGKLQTLRPTLSPAIWTSVVTGVRPERHGIRSFITEKGVPLNSSARAGRALWNIASMFGRKTLSVGWWMTWPAEEIDGWMVAPYSSAGQTDMNWKGNLRRDLPDQTWPRDLINEVYPFVERLLEARSFREIDQPFFGDVDLSLLDEQERRLVAETRWSVSADAAFAGITRHLLEKPEVKPDLTLVYLGGPDVASHRFWRYQNPDLFHYPIDGRAIAALSEIIHRFYEAADRMVGQILAAAPQDANVIVCSDHGFTAYATDARDPTGVSAHHLDGPPGVIFLAGPDIRAGGVQDLVLGRVLEIAPLVLYLLEIPLARDLDIPDGGSLLRQTVREGVLAGRPPRPEVATHNTGFRPPVAPSTVSETMNDDILEWMRQLGYTAAKTHGDPPK
ncbi:MAG: alkaline phosphatase family protein [Planctomycetota bacterium]